ncbi:unnamed protein product [Closterium sp. NIES-65]|nr:unnamed protein product [Closterium sp. NIES-65]
MYVLSASGEGDCYLRVPPDPGIRTSEAAALGTSVSPAPGAGEPSTLGASLFAASGAGEAATLGARESAPAASTEALHTFTLDSGASRCFFRDRTALEQLARPVAVSLADPSGGPVIATSSTILHCPAVLSSTLSGLYLPSFSTNLVAGSALQDGGVHQFTHAYERGTHCTCARTGRHLATFTRQPGSDLYTLTTESPQVAASASASSQLSAPYSCRSLLHQTVLWHHRLGHPSVQRLRGMHSRYLVSGFPRVLPPLPPSPAPPCLPCVEGRQRAAPHSSFPPTTAPLQTLHMDVWGPARVRGQGHERYFLIVVDDYSRYTTVFPLRTKGEVPEVLIPWIRAARLQLSERFHSDFPVLRLHSNRGGEFSSDLSRAFCQGEGIEQSFTHPASPQQNGVAERHIGLVMEVARTSLIHAAAPHFLWPFAVQYDAHQLHLWPRVFVPETSSTLRWTGEVEDASVFRVWGSRAFVRDTSADKLSSHVVPCVFLGFVPYASGAAVVDPLPPQGAAPSGVSQIDPVEPVEVAVDSCPARGAEPEREEPRGCLRVLSLGVLSLGVLSLGVLSLRVLSLGVLSLGVVRLTVLRLVALPLHISCGSGSRGTAASSGALLGPGVLLELVLVVPRLGGSCPLPSGFESGTLGAAVPGVVLLVFWTLELMLETLLVLEVLLVLELLEALLVLELLEVLLVLELLEVLLVPVLLELLETLLVLELLESLVLEVLVLVVLELLGLELQRELELEVLELLVLLVVLRDPTDTLLLATVVTDPKFESSVASALVAELVDFAAACRLDYAASLAAESECVCPSSVGGECALGTDVLEDRQEELQCLAAALPRLVSMLVAPEGDPDAPDIPTPRSYAEAIEGPYSSQWQTAMDAEMASWKSTGTYVDEIPPPGANIVSGM